MLTSETISLQGFSSALPPMNPTSATPWATGTCGAGTRPAARHNMSEFSLSYYFQIVFNTFCDDVRHALFSGFG